MPKKKKKKKGRLQKHKWGKTLSRSKDQGDEIKKKNTLCKNHIQRFTRAIFLSKDLTITVMTNVTLK